jgi:hypothetical protein
VFGVAFVALQFTKVEAPSNMQKRAYEDAVGYSTQVNDGSSPHYGGQSGGGFSGGGSYPQTTEGANPQYPPANYANPGAV